MEARRSRAAQQLKWTLLVAIKKMPVLLEAPLEFLSRDDSLVVYTCHTHFAIEGLNLGLAVCQSLPSRNSFADDPNFGTSGHRSQECHGDRSADCTSIHETFFSYGKKGGG